jgi:hypothetical protein
VLSICSTQGTIPDQATALGKTENAALLEMLKEKGSLKIITLRK